MSDEKQLLKEIETFRQRHDGMKESTFGRRCMKNPNFIEQLRAGSSPQLKTARKIRTWMKNEDTKLEKKNVSTDID